jgi:NADH-quinone oxidoreductase subunit M
MNKREWTMMVPIVVFIVWIGVYPSTFLKISENSTRFLVNKIELLKFGKSTYELPGYENPADKQELE